MRRSIDKPVAREVHAAFAALIVTVTGTLNTNRCKQHCEEHGKSAGGSIYSIYRINRIHSLFFTPVGQFSKKNLKYRGQNEPIVIFIGSLFVQQICSLINVC